MFKVILVYLALGVSTANAELLLRSGHTQPRSIPPNVGTPVSGEAEDATSALRSIEAPEEFQPSPPVTSSSINRKFHTSELNCQALENAAVAHDLPLKFFVRLIRQESNFDPYAVSHKGAQGIAQFMPGTARWRGLANPFEPVEALYESARWLRELREQFGNLGLAAAAYNAGPRRVQDWIAGRGGLPSETRSYVRVITGREAEEWARGATDDKVDPQKWLPCREFARRAPSELRNTIRVEDKTDWGPWGLQLVGGWSEAKALSDYKQLQKRFSSVLGDRVPTIIKSRMAGRGSAPWYLIRVAESTRDRAKQLCSKLESAGGNCLVFRN